MWACALERWQRVVGSAAVCALLSATSWVGGGVALAQTPPTLAGRWQASPMRAVWVVGEWGPACGPHPGGGEGPGEFLTIREVNGELSIAGARPISTASCSNGGGDVQRFSHSSQPRSWTTTCKSAADNERQVTIRTTITATDSAIQFDETGQYRFRADGQECTASSRRTRQYQLVERLAAPSEAEAPALNTAVPLAIDSKPRCQDLGPAVSGEVQPETKLLRPGDTATFEITLRDAAGCSLPTSAASVVFEPALGGVQWNAAGRVVAAADALEGETELVLRAGSVLDRAKISIVSQAHFESLMAAGSDERALIAAPTPAPTSVTTLGAETAVAENRAGTRKVLFGAFVGLTAASLGALGLVLLRQSRSRGSARTATAPSVGNAAPPLPKICPTCGRMYGGEAQFCGKDGSYLMPAN